MGFSAKTVSLHLFPSADKLVSPLNVLSVSELKIIRYCHVYSSVAADYRLSVIDIKPLVNVMAACVAAIVYCLTGFAEIFNTLSAAPVNIHCEAGNEINDDKRRITPAC